MSPVMGTAVGRDTDSGDRLVEFALGRKHGNHPVHTEHMFTHQALHERFPFASFVSSVVYEISTVITCVQMRKWRHQLMLPRLAL